MPLNEPSRITGHAIAATVSTPMTVSHTGVAIPPKNRASNIHTAPNVPQIKAPLMRPLIHAGLTGEETKEVSVVAIFLTLLFNCGLP
jgi:hypothetical protein